MRFGDRVNFTNAAIHARRNASYHKHFAECDIKKRSDLDRFFYDDLFHDSDIYSVITNNSGTVEIVLRNVYALDRLRARNRHSDAKREDFKTKVTFEGVVQFVWRPKPEPIFYLSEIDRLSDQLLRLDIYCLSEISITRVFRIDFETMFVEDIMPRLRKRFPKGDLRGFALWPEDNRRLD